MLPSLRWGAPDMQQPANINIMLADALVPNRWQAISSHHADSTVTIVLQKSYHITADNTLPGLSKVADNTPYISLLIITDLWPTIKQHWEMHPATFHPVPSYWSKLWQPCVTAIKHTMFQRCQVIRNHWFLWNWQADLLTQITPYAPLHSSLPTHLWQYSSVWTADCEAWKTT